jgi:hypothetical protein
MWKKKWGLWRIESERRPKTADRPHWVTILLGALSPVLAVVAVFISYRALQTSEKTLKVANRAYVALVTGKLHFADYGTAIQGEKGHLIVRMDLTATLQNAGHSPASAGPFERRYRLPDGWGEAPAWLKRRLGPSSVGEIAPRSTITWHYTDLFELTPDKYFAFQNHPGESVIYIDAGLTIAMCSRRPTQSSGAGPHLRTGKRHVRRAAMVPCSSSFHHRFETSLGTAQILLRLALPIAPIPNPHTARYARLPKPFAASVVTLAPRVR